MKLLYLHGFRSSPASFKARLMAQAMHERGLAPAWGCPQLPASPRAAADLAAAELAGHDASRAVVIGSSLGGFYATWLAERTGARAIVVNPVVHATRELSRHVGRHRMYHSDEPFDFRPEYVDELAALAVPRITRPERYLLLAATGDELLDWRDMREHYAGARQIIVEGGDHAFSDFAEWLPQVLEFAGIASTARPSS
ncbi:MAG: alpha/beta fold hydrolase [Pigmentiphaga sp.]|nr:alpha/beta fold hydrolase [Pigmentiphaga sp.]